VALGSNLHGAAGQHNAWLMGLEDEVGVIASGTLADIVIWNSDPLADITVLQRPSEISTIINRAIDRGAGGFRQLSDEPPRARISISGEARPTPRVLVGKKDPRFESRSLLRGVCEPWLPKRRSPVCRHFRARQRRSS